MHAIWDANGRAVHCSGDLKVAAAGASLAALGAALYPIVGPILEVRQLSQMSGEEVEAAVRPQEALQSADGGGLIKLFGEDALLDWPNALLPGATPRPTHASTPSRPPADQRSSRSQWWGLIAPVCGLGSQRTCYFLGFLGARAEGLGFRFLWVRQSPKEEASGRMMTGETCRWNVSELGFRAWV